MGWGGRGGRGWFGPWPGRGPFSHLPPWERPGWMFGRGACWWLFGPPAWYGRYPRYTVTDQQSIPYRYQIPPYYSTPPSPEDEIIALEESKKYLEEELKGIESRIEELKKTTETKE